MSFNHAHNLQVLNLKPVRCKQITAYVGSVYYSFLFFTIDFSERFLGTVVQEITCRDAYRYWIFYFFCLSHNKKVMSIIVQQDATIYSLLYFCKPLYMFRVVTPPIIRSTYNCNYSIWHWSTRLCYLLLWWRSWNAVYSRILLDSYWHCFCQYCFSYCIVLHSTATY
jgi:hypothetical protein